MGRGRSRESVSGHGVRLGDKLRERGDEGREREAREGRVYKGRGRSGLLCEFGREEDIDGGRRDMVGPDVEVKGLVISERVSEMESVREGACMMASVRPK